MSDQSDLLAGLSNYQRHEYLPALKLFTRSASQPTNELSQMIHESLQAVTNMQLCNYNQAAEQLNDLRHRISVHEQHQHSSEVELLKIKVLANLLVIYLVNCNAETESLLEEILEVVEERYARNKLAGNSLFRALLKSLFGFESFEQLQEELTKTLEKIDRDPRSKLKIGKQTKTLLLSPMFLSSLSIYCHLTGNQTDALKLQKVSYQLSKGQNAIAAVLSLRHLQQLHRQAGNQKQRRNCHQQLMVMMSSEELEGIAEQTLFRNYSLKVEEAHRIVAALMEKEKEVGVVEEKSITLVAVVRKMRGMRNRSNMEQVDRVIQIIKNDAAVLNVMAEAEFIRDAERQYIRALHQFIDIIKKNKERTLMRTFFNNFTRLAISSARPQKESRIINIDINTQEKDQEEEEVHEEHKPVTPVKGTKKHTTLFMPKNISNFRSQLPVREEENNKSSLNSSRLSVKPPQTSKNAQKNQVYLQPERDKGKYKISKEQPKLGFRNQKGRETGKGKTERSRSKDEVQFKQKNEINQFLRPQTIAPIREPARQQKVHLPVREEKIVYEEEYIKPTPVQPPKPAVEPPKNTIIASKKQTQVSNSPPKPINSIKHTNSITTTNINRPQIQQSSNSLKSNKTIIIQESTIKKQTQQQFQNKLLKIIKRCVGGEYIQKRHFSSDGGAQRFLKLSHHKDKLFWGQDVDHYDQSSYPLQDIKGIVYGKVTETMIKQSNKKLQPWKCFSLIMKKRSFDVYCRQPSDLTFWLPGLSLYLKDLDYDHQNYYMKKVSSSKIEKQPHNNIVLRQKVVTRFYSVGRLVWKRFLLRMQAEYLVHKKKDRKNPYKCASAYAIVVAAVKKLNYKPVIMQRLVE